MTKKANLKIKDYSISQEEFTLVYDEVLDMFSTDPVPDNLGKYYLSENYISHTDSNDGLFEKVYQWVKNYMLKKKVKLISSYVEKGTLLDIGAGTGDFLNQAKKSGWKVTGIEPSPAARKRAFEKGINLFEEEAEVGDRKFDVITMWHVLEHVPDVEKQIEWIKNHLSTDGVLIVAVPNFNSYDAKYYKSFWAAWDVPRHLHHFSSKSIKTLFETNGFNLIEQKPLIFDSFYVSLLSEKYKSTSLIKPVSAFMIGLRSNWRAQQNKEYSSIIYIIKSRNTQNKTF
ncbi:Methyltransferase domain-containing protein [Leeuwenhoekiella palythoae]|uniref:Methyltransferase domain-containing protein n=1 Tax=Leeuwenhoekiella palythoae TaxID=573501 RepID=A0A1M5VWB0_9FLAO|nr:methyltransferase family protein [Leeuwenhoekiella palythoae]SHH79498.1 Methyltransferase domain-containing protein [Leeuwenhoekiella palythoae]